MADMIHWVSLPPCVWDAVGDYLVIGSDFEFFIKNLYVIGYEPVMSKKFDDRVEIGLRNYRDGTSIVIDVRRRVVQVNDIEFPSLVVPRYVRILETGEVIDLSQLRPWDSLDMKEVYKYIIEEIKKKEKDLSVAYS
ncbi:MAG: hypothetical protein GXO63_02080 [Candidatus Micrarchaeota archaeon]|nr:hypothetical protein [Candidatus Micrarchaeota archaeon]